LLVILGHLVVPIALGGGVVGVTLFFVLSGYLITTILITDQESGGIRLGMFYARRARRLLPALSVFLVVMVATATVTVGDALAPALYIANWARAFDSLAGPLQHTWSLGVEEQFYLLWPLVLLVVPRRAGFLIAIIALSATARAAYPHEPLVQAASRFDAIAWGCLLGLGIVPRVPRLLVGVAVAALTLLTVYGDLTVSEIWGYTIAAPASFVVMTVLLRRSSGPLAWPPLMATGRISYGLYLWHYPIAWFVIGQLHTLRGDVLIATPGQLDDAIWTLGALALTFGAAIGSWVAIERHFLTGRPILTGHAQSAPRPATRSLVEALDG
jgi:peptidoglycan/LPS O-acetylase OafA/YrhL